MKNNLHLWPLKAPVLLIITIICFSYSNTCTLHGQSSPIAYAYPVPNLSIDGDLSDWPEATLEMKINEFPYDDGPESQEDFQASFKVAYNLNDKKLYVSVTIIDDDVVIDTSENASWNTQDAYTIYLDADHDPGGSGVAYFTLAEVIGKERETSVSWDNNMYDISWDPNLSNYQWENFNIAKSRSGNQLIYEMELFLGDRIQPNTTIGIDHMIIDMDSDNLNDYTFASWGGQGGKSNSSRRLGDVVLMKPDAKLGKVEGKVTCVEEDCNIRPSLLQFNSLEGADLWVATALDSLGQYHLSLPEGKYEMSMVDPVFYFKNEVIRVEPTHKMPNVSVRSNEVSKLSDIKIEFSKRPDYAIEKGLLHDFSPDRAVILDKIIQDYQSFYGIPGVSLALVKDGAMVYEKTYGVSNAFTQNPVSSETLFEAASITKPVFAYVVCRLAERNIIDLDKPLFEYLPFEEIAHDERYKKITARHVLTHQTGFPNWRWMNEDGRMDIRFDPGTSYHYSGEGFEYLKRVVMEITKKDIQVILDEEVLQPLGLKNTFFQHSERLVEVAANGHYDGQPTKSELPSAPGMAYSMYTNAHSFTSFMIGLQNGTGLSKATFDEMMTPFVKVPETNDYQQDWIQHVGLGVFMDDTPYGRTFGHGGNNGDFKCLFKMYPDVGLGFAVFTNGEHGDGLTEALERILVVGSEQIEDSGN